MSSKKSNSGSRLETKFKIHSLTPILAIQLLGAGCSVKKMAINSLAEALAESSSVYASESDLKLVRQAMPFGLKTMESLIAQAPRHRGLLIAAASGFAQYAYAFVEMDAFEIVPLKSRRPSRRRRARSA